MLLFPISWVSVEIAVIDGWKFENPSPGLFWLTIGSGIYTFWLCLYLSAAGYRYVKRNAIKLRMKQMRVMLLGVCVSCVWSISFSFYKNPAFPLSGINYPELGMFGIVIFALFLRYAMIKYDLLPSIEHKFQVLYERSPMSILLLDEDWTVKDANPQALKLFECTQEELLLRSLREFLSAYEGRGRVNVPLPASLLSGDYAIRTYMGQAKYVKANSEYIVSGGERFQYVVLNDVTDTKAAEDEVVHLAYHDTLTGLANRIQFQEQLQSQLVLSEQGEAPFAILLLDLDRFKQVNDTQGHYVGDQLLKQVARQLNRYAPENATIARLSGDEFALLVPDIPSEAYVSDIGRRLIDCFKEPFVHGGSSFYVTGSIGICLSSDHRGNADELLQFADIAMYQAKTLGRNRFVIYMPSFTSEAQGRFEVDAGLRKALEQGEFVLLYQPQMDMRTKEIIGVEALIRWNRPGIGMVPPNEFIPLAEESGIIVDIGYWVLETACLQLRSWMELGLDPVCMSINMSAKQFLDPQFPNILMDTLQRIGTSPELLCLEITESTAMKDEEYIMGICSEIMSLGVKLSIDDFGTGYSSLALLKRLSVHSIKIDRSFVKDMVSDENDRAIINAIIAMSHSLGKKVVAEGVEDQHQWHLLSALGCDEIQGYYVSRPLGCMDFERLMEGEARGDLRSVSG